MTPLVGLIQMLGSEMRRSQAIAERMWGGVQITSIQIALSATVEHAGTDALILRLGASRQAQTMAYELSVTASQSTDEIIKAYFDGKLLGEYVCNDTRVAIKHAMPLRLSPHETQVIQSSIQPGCIRVLRKRVSKRLLLALAAAGVVSVIGWVRPELVTTVVELLGLALA